MQFYLKLAWEPSVAQVTYSCVRRLPALGLGRFYRETKFLLEPLNFRLGHYRGSPEFPNQNLRPIGLGVPVL